MNKLFWQLYLDYRITTYFFKCWRDQKRKARTEGGARKVIKSMVNVPIAPKLPKKTLIVPVVFSEEMTGDYGPKELTIDVSLNYNISVIMYGF